MTSWILLSDVGEEDGPTKVVPLTIGQSVPYWPDTLGGSANDYVTNYLPAGAFAGEEISVTDSAAVPFFFLTHMGVHSLLLAARPSTPCSPRARYAPGGPACSEQAAVDSPA